MIQRVKKYILLLIVLLNVLNIFGSDISLEFREISPPGGFTFGSINQIIEDSHGFIWFSSQHGLFRYNTASIRKFIHISNDTNSILSNEINFMSKDVFGTLWFATNNGLCFYNEDKEIFTSPVLTNEDGDTLNGIINQVVSTADTQVFVLSNNFLFRKNNHNYIIDTVNIHENDNRPTFIYCDNNQRIWMKTTEGTVYWAEAPYRDFHHFGSILNRRVLTMLYAQQKFWVGYEWEGADCYDSTGNLLAHYGDEGENNIGSSRVRKIVEDKQGNIRFATYNGIAILRKDSILHFDSNNTPGISHSSVYDIFTDSKGGTWISTWSGKLAYSNPYDNLFTQISSKQGLSNNVVSSFAQSGNLIWIGTEGGGLNVYNLQTKTLNSVAINHNNLNVKSLDVDNEGNLWVGTFNSGLWRLSAFTDQGIPAREEKVVDGGFYSLVVDDSMLYAGSYFLGLYIINTQTNKTVNLRFNSNDPASLSSNQIRALFVDREKNLWVGTQNGLNLMCWQDRTFKRFISEKSDSTSLSSDQVYSINEDSNGQIWIGTSSGLNRLNTKDRTITCFTPNQGLAGYEIYGIAEDARNNLWLTTDNGITQFNYKTLKCRNFYESDGLQGNQFNPGAVFEAKNGDLYFGGPNGANSINPVQIQVNPVKPDVVFTGIQINNQTEKPGSPGATLSQSVLTLDHLDLKYNQNSINFEFVATNFLNPKKNQFKYRLLNYNDEWINTGTQHRVTFTKIPPGTYILQVLAANNDGIWNTVPKAITIRINYPWWQSWYAYSVYILLVISLVFLIQREIYIRQRLKHEVMLEKVKSNSEKELNQNKLQFFTNISHEIKTPLSLILYPLDYLIQHYRNDNELTEYLQTIRRNGKRLRNIISQVIDIRRIDAQKLSFKPIMTDIVPILHEIMDCFILEAREKNIRLTSQIAFDKLEATVDPFKFDNMIFNLLTNAIKFTPPEGEIKVLGRAGTGKSEILFGNRIDGNYLEISVFNSGSFIPEPQFNSIFERFIQSKDNTKEGTGIGLHMVAEYLKLHKGNLNLISDNERGTTFILRIPITDKELQTATKELVEEVVVKAEGPSSEFKNPDESDSKKKLILVVDDNAELRSFLKKSLSNNYAVITASDGEHGLHAAFEFNPDLIVSDVMMPVMDGFEMCQAVKNDENTNHIPVILLTALSEDEQKIRGFQKGADAYIAKPFSEELLLTQIKNLLQSRQKLKEAFLSPSGNIHELIHGDSDFTFVERASQIVESNLLDQNFSVEMLAEKMKISRTSLHRKIKAHTDQSASEFIRFVRLKKALKMLKTGDQSIDEISFAVGFNSASYFSSCFKKQFGKSPKEYLPL